MDSAQLYLEDCPYCQKPLNSKGMCRNRGCVLWTLPMEKLLDKENHIIPPDTPEPFPDKHAADVAVVVASLTVGDRMAMVAGKPGS